MSSQPTDSKSSSSHGLGSLFNRFTEQVSGLNVNQLQNTIRQQVVNYDPRQQAETLKLQLVVKAAKGVSQDYSALANDEKVFSKNLYVWGQEEKGEDLKDLTDRLAFLIFKEAELNELHAKRLEQSRQALKDIRNFENNLIPKRLKRDELSKKIETLKAGKQSKNAPSQLAQMESDLAQLENEDSTLEQSLNVLKRTKLFECFQLQSESQKELGEKLAILGGYGELLLQGMDTDGVGIEYKGSEKSARIRAQVVQDLESWTATNPRIAKPEVRLDGASMLGRSDTRSFGTTHANELSQIGNSAPGSHLSPSPAVATPGHGSANVSPLTSPPLVAPVPINPISGSERFVPPPPPQHISTNSNPLLPEGAPAINLSPTLSPTGATVSSPILSPPPLRDPNVSTSSSTEEPPEHGANVPSGPTVAETGAPVVGGGEKSGQLRRASISKDQKTISLASLGSNDGTVLPSSPPLGATPSGSGINRMNTTNRRRMEASENALGGEGEIGELGEEQMPPAYKEEVDEVQRRAEEILASERERKRTAAGGV